MAPTASFIWLFTSFDGRIDRQVYWLGIGLLWCVLFVLVGLMIEPTDSDSVPAGIIFLAIPSLWCEMALLVKRQHDRGLAWYWCLLAFVPLAGVAWMVFAGLVPGNSGPNAYGARTNEKSA